jgi:hypothetical protein
MARQKADIFQEGSNNNGTVTTVMWISRTKQNYHRHGFATCTCIDRINAAMPVLTKPSAHPVWEKSNLMSGGASILLSV